MASERIPTATPMSTAELAVTQGDVDTRIEFATVNILDAAYASRDSAILHIGDTIDGVPDEWLMRLVAHGTKKGVAGMISAHYDHQASVDYTATADIEPRDERSIRDTDNLYIVFKNLAVIGELGFAHFEDSILPPSFFMGPHPPEPAA